MSNNISLLHDYQDSKGRFKKGHAANTGKGNRRGITVKRTEEEMRVRNALSRKGSSSGSMMAMRIVFSQEEAKPLRSTLLEYMENDFKKDFFKLEPDRRLYYFEKLLPFFLPRATPDINITTENQTIVASDLMSRFFQSKTETRKVQDIDAQDITNSNNYGEENNG